MAGEVDLPPLPFLPDNNWHRVMMVRWGTEIARAAILAERERCAKIADWMPDGSGHFGNVAEAIRKGEWGASHVADPAYQQEQREKNERARRAMDAASSQPAREPSQCPHCDDVGWEWEHGLGGESWKVPCPKHCAAAVKWIADEYGEKEVAR